MRDIVSSMYGELVRLWYVRAVRGGLCRKVDVERTFEAIASLIPSIVHVW